jgi:hypothetical protein
MGSATPASLYGFSECGASPEIGENRFRTARFTDDGCSDQGSIMSGPFIFIATNRLREGKLAAERERAADLTSFIEASEPQLLAFNDYANEEGTEVGVGQVHPDAASMEFHMEVVAERAARAYAETLEATTSIEVYGQPSDAVLEMLGRQAGAGVPMTVKRHHLGGFSRIQSG